MSDSKIQRPSMPPYLVCFSISLIFLDPITCFTVRLKLKTIVTVGFSLEQKLTLAAVQFLIFLRDLILNLTGFLSPRRVVF